MGILEKIKEIEFEVGAPCLPAGGCGDAGWHHALHCPRAVACQRVHESPVPAPNMPQMSRTQKNKATEYHLGQLKAKLAKLRTQLQEPSKVGCAPAAPAAAA